MDKTCFIISTIGSEDSDDRKNSDQKLEHLFKPILHELGYEVKRADKVDIPGSISLDIVSRLISSTIVIADVSDLNPNVFYELAIRNAVMKPVIIIKKPDQKPPFDIQDKRAISVDMEDPDIWIPAKDILKKQIIQSEKNPKLASESILSSFAKDLAINPSGPNIDKDVSLQIKAIREDIKSIKSTTQEKNPTIQKYSSYTKKTEEIDSSEMLNISIDRKSYLASESVDLNVFSPLLNGSRRKIVIDVLSDGHPVGRTVVYHTHNRDSVPYEIDLKSRNLRLGEYALRVRINKYSTYEHFRVVSQL